MKGCNAVTNDRPIANGSLIWEINLTVWHGGNVYKTKSLTKLDLYFNKME